MPIQIANRILMGDDFAIVREGLEKAVDATPDLEVVAEAEKRREAVDKALRDDIRAAILGVSDA
jgi:DNA-binding NarL/FixJ family response regulator